MGKLSQQNQKKSSPLSNNTTITTNSCSTNAISKVKRKRKSVPRDSPPRRSSIYRGVTRHRWTGRYEAHLWDKNCWNESQSKKGRQVYLGAYDGEEAAAHAYDLAALKYWGKETILNFPISTYEKEMKEMESQSREEYIGSLRRRSNGFSRGVSKFRGVARHHHNGRWEARIGRVFGNKYLYLGTYATQEEAATAYDMAAIECRGLNAVTNFDLSRYIKWLRPHNSNPNLTTNPSNDIDNMGYSMTINPIPSENTTYQEPPSSTHGGPSTTTTMSSSAFKEMLEQTSESERDQTECYSTTLSESNPQPMRCCTSFTSFPNDIQTYFECTNQESGSYVEGEDFGDLNSFSTSIFHCELDLSN